jgi:hypothetical protein
LPSGLPTALLLLLLPTLVLEARILTLSANDVAATEGGSSGCGRHARRNWAMWMSGLGACTRAASQIAKLSF